MKDTASAKRDTLLDITEAAAQLGMKEKGIRNWIVLRSIDFVKLGDGPRAAIRIRQSTIDALIEKGSVPAMGKKPRAIAGEREKARA